MKNKMKTSRTHFRTVVYYSLLVVLTTAVFAACRSSDVDSPEPIQSSGVLTAKCLTYRYNFSKGEDRDGDSFEIICNGTEVVYRASADSLGFISADRDNSDETDAKIKPHDIDGDGTPDLIVLESNGNCCLDYTVISLEETLREYKLENVGAEFELVDLDDDGKFEIKTTDTTFFEDPTGNRFDEPVPEIILEARNGRYEFSPRFMKNVKAADIFRRFARSERQDVAGAESLELDKKLTVELIYHGKGDQALNRLDAVYDHTPFVAAKNEMANEIINTVTDSPYWKQIGAMNKWHYEAPEGELACPEFAGRTWLRKTE